MYVASTFGLLISDDDGCTMRWVCESKIGFRGTWDPKYAIAADGAIFATTYDGLRVSRDGGCSFTTATAELAPGSPNRIAEMWIDALDIAPTGQVWVGTAQTGHPNDVYVSDDNGVSFKPTGLASTTIFWKSIKVAPTNAARVYASGYELTPPTAHVRFSKDGGRTWTASELRDVQFGITPISLVGAVDPTDPDVVYLISQGAAQSGDKLYRSSDGGSRWTEVLSSTGPISGVVIADAQTVYATTLMQSGTTFVGGPLYRSKAAGTQFEPMSGAPGLACLGIAPGGDLIGCAANWEPDFAAVMRSSDAAASFTKVWRFVELADPLPCPAGTAEEDVCHQRMWENVKAQFGATGPTCGANVGNGTRGTTTAPRASGCCESGGGPWGAPWVGAVALWFGRRRRQSRAARRTVD